MKSHIERDRSDSSDADADRNCSGSRSILWSFGYMDMFFGKRQHGQDDKDAECQAKIAHVSYTDAELMWRRMRRRSQNFTTYRCQFCGCWHNGSQLKLKTR